jgi:hypothetical protein
MKSSNTSAQREALQTISPLSVPRLSGKSEHLSLLPLIKQTITISAANLSQIFLNQKGVS